jgi:hypothetical protein
MLRISHNYFQPSKERKLTQTLFLSMATVLAVVSATFLDGVKVNAQNPPINNAEVKSYAISLLKMEPLRQGAYDDIKKIMAGKEPPRIICSDSNSVNSIPTQAQGIAVKYCQSSQKIVTENGLSVNRFNEITAQIPDNPGLQKRIQEELIKIQNNKSKSKSKSR